MHEAKGRVGSSNVPRAPSDVLRVYVHSAVHPDVPDLTQNSDSQAADAAPQIEEAAPGCQVGVRDQTICLRKSRSEEEPVVSEPGPSESEFPGREDRTAVPYGISA